MKLFRNVLKLVLLLAVAGKTKCDYYTSISGLEELLVLESHYVESLEKHLNEVERQNNQFISLLEEVELEHSKMTEHNTTQYFDDPINAFKVMRRIVVDVPQMAELTSQIWNLKVFNESIKFHADKFTLPTLDDLRGASLAFSRLQRMYKLETGDMAKGYLKGHKYSSAMSAHNCFILGQSLYEAGEYNLASEWLLEALLKVEDMENGLVGEDEKYVGEDEEDADDAEEDETDDSDDEDEDESEDQSEHENDDDKAYDEDDDADEVDDIDDSDESPSPKEYYIYPYINAQDILEYLPASLFNAGHRKLAMSLNAKLLVIDPQNQYGLANRDIFTTSIKAERRKRIMDKPSVKVSEKQRLYNEVCSGEAEQTAREKRHLRCRYVTNNVPFYFVGPLKMEELNTEPFVAYYHQVIHDNEIDQIIGAAEDSIERSRVGENTNSRYDEVRVSKNSWLGFAEHEFLDKIAIRLEDITGLTIASGEPLQVANYGIGGHYGPHHDFFETPNKIVRGNRILTALFYINDVELGGATAFPVLRLAVPPVKGSLVVWYNFHKSMQPDYRTWHAGCPVLQGSKWICNEWFGSDEQEFKRPCGLEADDAISKPYKNWE